MAKLLQVILAVGIPLSVAASSLPATVQVLSSNESGLSIRVTVPDFTPGTLENSNGHFTTLTLPGSGLLGAIGKPALPVIRRLIMAPDTTDVSCTFTGAPLMTSLSTLGCPPQIIPVQPPVPKIRGALESAAFALDASLYASLTAYPAAPVSLTEAGVLFGRRLLSLEVCPFAITPSTGSLLVHTNLEITIHFSGRQAATAEATLTSREQTLLAKAVLNPPLAGETVTATQKRLLLIAHSNVTNGLAAFVSHKTNRGWLVECITTNSTQLKIQAVIKARYANPATRPDALLLIGDTSQIPCFDGNTTDSPDTDLYYGCMDGGSDWFPEFPVGRFSVTTTNQLAAVLAKSMAHEQSALESWIKRATFMASDDNHVVSEGTHNAVITGTLNRLGYASERLFCYSSNAIPAQVRKAFNNGCVLGVYSGHGSTTRWDDGPFFTQGDINSLTNAAHFPIVCSFACLTGQFSLPECFAETWLRAPAKGAAAILASSVTSYWDEDDILEKKLFAALFEENQSLFGTAVWRAKQLYREYYGDTATTKRYFEQYNLLGDPTLDMIGLPVLTNGIPHSWFTSQGITNTDYTLELQQDRDGDGMTALQEYLAGTHPGDPQSALKWLGAEPSTGSLRLSWASANSLVNPLPVYQIWSRTNLATGAWQSRTNILIHTPPTNTVNLTVPPNTPQLFYRITVTN